MSANQIVTCAFLLAIRGLHHENRFRRQARRTDCCFGCNIRVCIGASSRRLQFDQLFGGGAETQAPVQQPATPGYSFDQPGLGESQLPQRHRVVKKKVAAVDTTPKLQKTTDLMSDKTLRPGDAVMMKSGVHIFVGDRDEHHDASEFVALDARKHVSKHDSGELLAMDVAHRAPLDYVGGETTMLEGRSVGGRPINEGYKVTDALGRSIRYVGP